MWFAVGVLMLSVQLNEPVGLPGFKAGGQPIHVEAPVERIFVPKGFDDNDITQIIVMGRFADDRHRVVGAQVRKDPLRNRIYYEIEALEYSTPTGDEEMEYVQVVDVGLLPKGQYQILPLSKKEEENIGALGSVAGILNVKHTDSPRRDDHIYAAVDSAVLQKNEDGLRRNLVVFGTKNNSCLEFDGKLIDRFGVKKTDSHLIEVLPIMKKEGRDCISIKEPFEFTFRLPEDISSGRYLFHIRTYDGNSFNKMSKVEGGVLSLP